MARSLASTASPVWTRPWKPRNCPSNPLNDQDYASAAPGVTAPYLNQGPPVKAGGEWLLSVIGSIAPQTPGLIWVHGPRAGDVMVDGSIRGERLRPLGLWRTAALGQVSEKLREPAGSLKAIWDLRAWAEAIDGST